MTRFELPRDLTAAVERHGSLLVQLDEARFTPRQLVDGAIAPLLARAHAIELPGYAPAWRSGAPSAPPWAVELDRRLRHGDGVPSLAVADALAEELRPFWAERSFFGPRPAPHASRREYVPGTPVLVVSADTLALLRAGEHATGYLGVWSDRHRHARSPRYRAALELVAQHAARDPSAPCVIPQGTSWLLVLGAPPALHAAAQALAGA